MTSEAGGERHPEDGWPVVAFADQRAFEAWLAANEGGGTGLWVKFAKKACT